MRTTAATLRSVGASARNFLFSLKSVVLALSMVLDVPSPVCAQSPAERVTDDVLALRVQAAIASDPPLKPLQLNLIVNVVDRRAVIGGELPDLKWVQRLETVVSKVTGIRGVQVSCWESTKPGVKDPFAGKVQDYMAPLPAPKPLPPEPPRVLSIPTDERDRTAIVPKDRPSPASVMLEPVVASIPNRLRSTTPGAAPAPYDTIPPTNLPTKTEESADWKPVTNAVDWHAVRDRDVRYANLNVRKLGRQYTVIGAAGKLTDAWDFAELLRDLPHVDTVVVGKIELK